MCYVMCCLIMNEQIKFMLTHCVSLITTLSVTPYYHIKCRLQDLKER